MQKQMQVFFVFLFDEMGRGSKLNYVGAKLKQHFPREEKMAKRKKAAKKATKKAAKKTTRKKATRKKAAKKATKKASRKKK